MKNIWSAAHTDVGIKKNINQDAVILKIAGTASGKLAFAVICDGMGGLQQGEVASEMLCRSYEQWFRQELPIFLKEGMDIRYFQTTLEQTTLHADARMKQYGRQHGIRLGTTATILLIVEEKYYIFHVGDTRVYRITGSDLDQLTTDHTCRQQQNVLLQCVGASGELHPEVLHGEIGEPVTFLLCSDGFRHKVEKRELFQLLNPLALQSEEVMQTHLYTLTERSKERGETDNISAIALKIF